MPVLDQALLDDRPQRLLSRFHGFGAVKEESSLANCAHRIVELDAVVGKDLQQPLTHQVAKGLVENHLVGTSRRRNKGSYFLTRQGRITEAEQFGDSRHCLRQPFKRPVRG